MEIEKSRKNRNRVESLGSTGGKGSEEKRKKSSPRRKRVRGRQEERACGWKTLETTVSVLAKIMSHFEY